MPNALDRYPGLADASPEQKLEVLDELWESVRRSGEIPVPPSHLGELERRLSTVQADESLALTPEQARALLRQ